MPIPSLSHSFPSIIILIIFLSYFLLPVSCSITSLSLTASPTTINSMSTHTWSITYSNSASRQTFVLYFPDCDSIINGITTVMYNSVQVSNITEYGATFIKFVLPAPVTATSYSFVVNNVKNCYRTANYSTFVIFNNNDGNQTGTAAITLYYR